MADTTLGGAVDFFKELGLFDVVLPFILVFAIVFAILEKTRLLGQEKDGTPKKNLNSLVALVLALLVLAVNAAVNFISLFFTNAVLIIVASLGFLLILGLFRGDEEFKFSEAHSNWYNTFVVLAFVGLAFVVLNSIETSSGDSFLETAWDYAKSNIGEGAVTGVIILVIVALVLIYATGGFNKNSGGGDED